MRVFLTTIGTQGWMVFKDLKQLNAMTGSVFPLKMSSPILGFGFCSMFVVNSFKLKTIALILKVKNYV